MKKVDEKRIQSSFNDISSIKSQRRSLLLKAADVSIASAFLPFCSEAFGAKSSATDWGRFREIDSELRALISEAKSRGVVRDDEILYKGISTNSGADFINATITLGDIIEKSEPDISNGLNQRAITLLAALSDGESGDRSSNYIIAEEGMTRGGPSPKFSAIRREYLQDYNNMKIPGKYKKAIELCALSIIKRRSRYEKVVSEFGTIPWYFVGIIHLMETGLNFGAHLHNGDTPLSQRTRNVPKNRPTEWELPYSWEVSARDALKLRRLLDEDEWFLEKMLFNLEGYNGWGYRNSHLIKSPYLWSFSSLYSKGKFTSDHVFDPNKVSNQPGAAVVLKFMEQGNFIAIPRG